MKNVLIILTWNEVEGVKEILPKISRENIDKIIAIDRSSTDGTQEVLSQYCDEVLQQKNPGRGEAMRQAIHEVDGKYLVFFSPDGNEDWRDIPKLFSVLSKGADIAIASRFLPASHNEEDDKFLPIRKWANMLLTGFVNIIWNKGVKISDSINGFRGVNRERIMSLNLQSSGYTIEYEMTIHACKKRMKIAEIPTYEGDRVGGQSKGPTGKIMWAFLRCFIRELL